MLKNTHSRTCNIQGHSFCILCTSTCYRRLQVSPKLEVLRLQVRRVTTTLTPNWSVF